MDPHDWPLPYLTSSLLLFALASSIFSFLFETTMDLRQLAVLRRTEMPTELEGLVGPTKFQQARAYSLDKMRLHLLHSVVSFLQHLGTLIFALFPWLWQATAVEMVLGGGWFDSRREIEHSLLFLGASSLISMILDLPFSLYSTFVVEQRHGFNKQTLGLFFLDLLKSTLLALVIGGPVTAAIIAIARAAGNWLVLGLWLFSLVLSLFFLTIYPIAIAPLFNRFVPLEPGSLRESIERLAASLRFPLTRIFVVDGSRRSAHSNAYLYGFFRNKRVVLYDTLIKQCSEEEVVAVIGHEMGHWKRNHTIKSFVTSQILMLFNFGGYALVSSSQSVFTAFGFPSSRPVVIGFVLFQLISSPLDHILTFGLHLISRRYEFEADEFAVDMGLATALRGGLIKLQEENKSAMVTDPLYSAYHYSHPPFAERLRAIEARAKSMDKKRE